MALRRCPGCRRLPPPLLPPLVLLVPAAPLLTHAGIRSTLHGKKGTMTWGEQNTEEEAWEQLDYALAHGVNFIDTGWAVQAGGWAIASAGLKLQACQGLPAGWREQLPASL